MEETSVFRDFAKKVTQQVVVLMANSLFLQNKSICSAVHSFWVWVFFCLQFPPAGFCTAGRLMCGTAQIWYLSASSAFFFSLKLKAAPFFAELNIMKTICSEILAFCFYY